jgi:hypothetical protein
MTLPAGRAPSAHRATVVVAALAIAAAIALGVVLRLADPLSSSVVPAEDPYTHMALVREHLRTGQLDGLWAHQDLYPPGLHGFLAAAWVYTGFDLYSITLYGPVVFGAIGILGMGLLLWRTSGPTAGFVAALAMAVMPEAIFRTTMMSPTALDMAVLPFLLGSLLMVLSGRLRWVGVAAPLALFLALAHPWLLAILCAAGAVSVVLALLLPSASPPSAPSPLGIAACMAVLGVGFAIALRMPGFGDALQFPGPGVLDALALAVGALALAPLAVLGLLRRRGVTLGWPTRGPGPWWLRLALSACIAIGLVATYEAALQHGLPTFVDLPLMLGWPVLLLAALALVALPFIASPMAHLAAGLFAATFPFVIFNPLHSEFLPHRTVVFLGLSLAALAGVAAGAAAHSLALPLRSWVTRGAAAGRRLRGPAILAAVPAVLVATLLGGSIYAGTPDSYPGGWYRLYTPCELDALRDVARQADAMPDAVVVAGDWQAKLVLAGLSTDAQRIWYDGRVFTSEKARDALVAQMDHDHRPILLVVDRYLHSETPDADTSFASSPPWHETASSCSATALGQPRVVVYATDGGAP